MTPRRVRTLALVGALAFVAMHGVLSWLFPIAGEDWAAPMWDQRFSHLAGLSRILRLAAEHWTVPDAVSYSIVSVPVLHAVISPLVALGLVIGIFTLAFGRMPRLGDEDDVLALALGSAFVWIANSRPGLLYFHRTFAATWIYTSALSVWVLGALRGVWSPPRWAHALFILAAFCAGAGTRQTGVATALAAVALLRRIPRSQRARWMYLGAGAACVGAVAGLFDVPFLEVRRVFSRGLEQNLNLLIVPLRQTGALVSVAALLALAKLVIERRWPGLRPANADERASLLPDSSLTLKFALVTAGLAAFGLFGPNYSDESFLPAALVAVVAILPYYRWLASSRPLRYALIAIAVGTHIVSWGIALATYAPIHAEFEDRMARVRETPKGTIATVVPYQAMLPNPYRFGEDWGAAAFRQLLAIEVFGLRDIDFATDFRKLDPNPGVDIRFESTGLTPEHLRAARAPSIWASQPVAARLQFEGFVRRLEDVGATGFSARLVVHGVDTKPFDGRPLLVAWYEHDRLIAPRVQRGNTDEYDRIPISIKGDSRSLFSEAWIISSAGVERAEHDRYVRISPMTTENQAIVICAIDRCLLAEALAPRF